MNRKQMLGLWNLLLQTWGQKFAEQYGSEPNEAWTMYLSSVGIDPAKEALRSLVMEGSPFPPTLPEFMALCRRYTAAQAKAQETKALLEQQKPQRTGEAERNIAKIREMLGRR